MDHYRPGSLSTNATGNYSVVLGEGNYVVDAVWSDATPTGQFSVALNNDRSQDFSFTTAQVSGTITDALNNSPVAGAAVTISGVITSSTTSDSNGQYQFDRVLGQTGEVTVSVEDARYVTQSRSVPIPPSVADLNFMLTFPDITVDSSPINLVLAPGEETQISLTIGNAGLADLNWRSRIQTTSHSGLFEETPGETITQLDFISLPGAGGLPLAAGSMTYDGVDLFATSSFISRSIGVFDPDRGGDPKELIVPSNGGAMIGLTHDGRDIWAVIDQDLVARIDPFTGEELQRFAIERPHPEAYLYGLAYGDGSLWVATTIYDRSVPAAEFFPVVNRIRRVNPVNGQVIDQIAIDDLSLEGSFIRPRLSWSDGLIWLNDRYGLRYIAIDSQTGQTVQEIENPWGNFPDSEFLQVAGPGIDDQGRLYVVTNFGPATAEAQPRLIASGRRSWLGADNRGGVIATGANTTVTLTVTADRAGLGEHRGQVIFGSDDPDNHERRISIPVNLTVTDGRTNQAPIIEQIVSNADRNNNVALPRAFLPVATVADPDGDPLTYSWGYVSGPDLVEISDSDTINPSMLPVSAGTYTFRLVATDDRNASTSQDVIVNITATGERQAFIIDPIAHEAVFEANDTTSVTRSSTYEMKDSTQAGLTG